MEDPGILSLLPALLAIVLAFVTRNVIISLATAVVVAGVIVAGGNPIKGVVHAVDPVILGVLADRDHMKIILFTLFIGGMVGVMTKGGGSAALVGAVARLARTPRSAQLAAWLSGIVVFFDDYANCLIVGNTLRPLTDEHRVSRAKLAYIVDSTAAPVAMLALLSTWVGFAVGLVEDGLEKAGVDRNAYAFFVEGLGYRFYPILTIVFVGAVILMRRDFGPMVRAEANPEAGRAVGSEGPPSGEAAPTAPERPGLAWLAIAPIATLLGVTLLVIWRTGRRGLPSDAGLSEIFGNADSYDAMIQGSLAALVLAVALALVLRAMSLDKAMKAATDGMRALFDALTILVLAWSLGAAMDELGAGEYLVGALEARLPAAILPTTVFVVGALTAFATGTSFGTMAILMPIVLPLAFSLSSDPTIALAASGSVLAGATFGDHCSPISDTTVLSSIGTGCDHVVHVETQIPYAVAAALVSIVFGTIPAGFGVPLWVTLPLGAGACIAVVRILGRRPATATSGGGDGPPPS